MLTYISHAHISNSKRCFNVKSSTYYFHVKTNILEDFQIYISAPLNDDIFTCCRGDISVWIWRSVLHLSAQGHCGPGQVSKMCFFARIVNSVKLMLLTIFANSSQSLQENSCNGIILSKAAGLVQKQPFTNVLQNMCS